MEFSTNYRGWYLIVAIFFTLSVPVCLILLLIIGVIYELEDLIPIYIFLSILTVVLSITFTTNFKKVILHADEMLVSYLILKKTLIVNLKDIEGYRTSSRGAAIILKDKKEIIFSWMVWQNPDNFLVELEKRGIKKMS